MRKIILFLLILLLIGCIKRNTEPLKIEIIEPTVIIHEQKNIEAPAEHLIEQRAELLKLAKFRKVEREAFGTIEFVRITNQTSDYKLHEFIFLKIEKFSFTLDKEQLSDFSFYLTKLSFPDTYEKVKEGFFDLGKLQNSSDLSYLVKVKDINEYNALIIINTKSKKVYVIASLQDPRI